MPVLLRPSSRWMFGAAIETIVWSMNVIDTAKIIAASTRRFDPLANPADSSTRGVIYSRAAAATRAIRDEAELREIVGLPSDLVVSKIADRLNDLTRQLVERSLCLRRDREPRR